VPGTNGSAAKVCGALQAINIAAQGTANSMERFIVNSFLGKGD
jgi:hypothetical protein